MLEIKSLGKEHDRCINMLDGMFKKFGIKPLDTNKPMPYWSVKSKNSEVSLLNDPILSVDEHGNELRAVFFVTRQKRAKKLKLFRFTELFAALNKTENDVTIAEAIECFIEEKADYIPPVAVVCLGKILEDGELYAGGFLYEVIVNGEICIETEKSEPQNKSEDAEEIVFDCELAPGN